MEVFVVTDQTTRADIIAMLVRMRAAQKRAPKAMTPRFHERYDALLTALEQAR